MFVVAATITTTTILTTTTTTTTTKGGIALLLPLSALLLLAPAPVDVSKPWQSWLPLVLGLLNERGDPRQSCKIQGVGGVKIATDHAQDNFNIAHGAPGDSVGQ